MTKVVYGRIVVSFNTSYDEYELGESDMNSVDFTGNNEQSLIDEVIAVDVNFPLVFVRATAEQREDGFYGRFVSKDDDDYTVALMLDRDVHLS